MEAMLQAQGSGSKTFIHELMSFEIKDIPPDLPHHASMVLVQALILQSTVFARIWVAFVASKKKRSWYDIQFENLCQFADLCEEDVHEFHDLCTRQVDTPIPQCVYHVPRTWWTFWSKVTPIQSFQGMAIWSGSPLPFANSPLAIDAKFSPTENLRGTYLWALQGHECDTDVQNALCSALRCNTTRVILGLPTARVNLQERILKFCEESNGWRAYAGVKPVTHRLTYVCTKLKRYVTLDWFVLQPPDYEGPHLDLSVYISGLSSLARKGRGVYRMPPLSVYCTAGKKSLRDYFWEHWETLSRDRQGLFAEKHTDWSAVRNNMNQANYLAKWSPVRWIRKLHAFSEIRGSDVGNKGCFVYVIYNARTSQMYVGETGRKSDKSVLERFASHLSTLRAKPSSWSFKEAKVYPAIRDVGVGEWVIMPLQQTRKHNALSLEAMWMKKLQSSPNVRKGHKGVKWRLLRRVGGAQQRHTAKEIQVAVHHALTVKRNPTPLHAALNLLIASKTAVDKRTHYRLYQRVCDRLKRATGVWLPYRLPVPYPQTNGTEARELRRDFKSLTDLIIVPGIIRKYLNSVMCPVGVKGPCVKQILCTSTVNIPWVKVEQLACMSCQCSQLPASVPRVGGCAVIRGDEAISTVFLI